MGTQAPSAPGSPAQAVGWAELEEAVRPRPGPGAEERASPRDLAPLADLPCFCPIDVPSPGGSWTCHHTWHNPRPQPRSPDLGGPRGAPGSAGSLIPKGFWGSGPVLVFLASPSLWCRGRCLSEHHRRGSLWGAWRGLPAREVSEARCGLALQLRQGACFSLDRLEGRREQGGKGD